MQRRSEVSARARGAVSRLQCLVKGGPRGLSKGGGGAEPAGESKPGGGRRGSNPGWNRFVL